MYRTEPNEFPPPQPPRSPKKRSTGAVWIVLAFTAVALVSVTLGPPAPAPNPCGSMRGETLPKGILQGLSVQCGHSEGGDPAVPLACSIARHAVTQTSIDAVLGDAAKIRFINSERMNAGIADGWTDQMWQVVDAANGFAYLRNEPDLTDGGIGLRASMHNLIELCAGEGL